MRRSPTEALALCFLVAAPTACDLSPYRTVTVDSRSATAKRTGRSSSA